MIMEVLITGGCGFIGSHVAEKFNREGSKVVIIDNLTNGSRDNVGCKHKFYQLDVEDKECENVFRNHNFSVVIHLAAQIDVKDSINRPYTNSRTNILGLVNMLELSVKYNVEKFIFASSAAVFKKILEMTTW